MHNGHDHACPWKLNYEILKHWLSAKLDPTKISYKRYNICSSNFIEVWANKLKAQVSKEVIMEAFNFY